MPNDLLPYRMPVYPGLRPATGMTMLDRAITYFAPRKGLSRLRAREAVRIYEGASVGRRTSSWHAVSTGANAELQMAIRPLRDRARDLARNTPHASRMLNIMSAHTVGTGLKPVINTGSDKVDKGVQQLWDDWIEKCDVTERITFNAMQVLALRSMIESGEVIARFIDKDLSDDLAVPLQIQLLEADYIDHYRDGIYGTTQDSRLQGVRKTRLGVGLGPYDKWMGLWLWPWHPGEINTINLRPLLSQFIRRDELLHMFTMLRPGQVRGVPWFAPVLQTARDMFDFIDAANVKARVEACFSAFVTNGEDYEPLMDPTQADIDQTITDLANPDTTVTTLEPGMIKNLRTGQDIKFAQPTSNTQIEPLLMYNLQAMAAGVGCTYDQATGDLRQANYSSLRAGKLDFWALIDQLQQNTVIPMFCKPVYERFLSRAILAGRLRERPGGYPCDWVVPARPAVDPKKDLDAEKNEVRAGRVTPQAYIAARGGNWRNTLKDFKAYRDQSNKLDLVFDTDAGRVDQHGRQPPKGAKPEGEDTDPADAEDAANEAKDNADAED